MRFKPSLVMSLLVTSFFSKSAELSMGFPTENTKNAFLSCSRLEKVFLSDSTSDGKMRVRFLYLFSRYLTGVFLLFLSKLMASSCTWLFT